MLKGVTVSVHDFITCHIEKIGVRRWYIQISAGTQAIVTEVFVVFLSPSRQIPGLPTLGHRRFLLSPFQLIIHQSCPYTLYNLDTESVVKPQNTPTKGCNYIQDYYKWFGWDEISDFRNGYSTNMKQERSRYSDWLRAGRPRGRSSSAGNVKNFSLLHVVQTGSGVHPTSYPNQF
jgi:hypothetical protein